MKNKIHRIFIYGTLKKGQYFHNQYLSGDKSNFLGNATTSNEYQLYIDGMPHLIREKTDTPCKGELYEINDDVLKSLDDLESHPIVYKRELIDVYDEKGQRVLAWGYLRSPSFKGKSQAHKEEEFF